jgi:hypothetical protein
MAENQTDNKNKSRKKMILLLLLIVFVVVAVGVAAYLLSQNPATSNNGGNPTATPTGTPSTSSPTPTSTSVDIADATSLKYIVSVTENGVLQGSYTYQGKNAGTSNFMMRIDVTDSEGDTTLIFNGAQHKAWSYSGGEWTDISDFYDLQFQTWDNLWSAYATNLQSWAGIGDYTYSDGVNTVRIYDIAVNPSLPDSLFVYP